MDQESRILHQIENISYVKKQIVCVDSICDGEGASDGPEGAGGADGGNAG